jgi:hypothetical protein
MSNKPSTPHGRGVRGFNLPRSSLLFEGNFGRMFRALPVAEFGSDDEETRKNLKNLADDLIGDEAGSEDRPDDEESGIPSLYTYLGQFVDHDLTFDPSSSLQQLNDIDGLVNYRTPRFDLDNIYGRGPDDQPYMYISEEGKKASKFLLGKRLTGGTKMEPPARDLPRNSSEPARAIIGDPRNDENVIVSQLQSLFLRFHNRLVDDNPEMPFSRVQREVRFHYQWMLINDFLPRFIHPDVYNEVFPHYEKEFSIADAPPELKFYHAKNEPFMPFEFSAAAYRFGHSMVRPGYRLNDNDETLLPIFGAGRDGRRDSLLGFMAPKENWGIDWARFIDIEDRPDGKALSEGQSENDLTPEQKKANKERLQFAYRIDTSIVLPLSTLPPSVADKIISSLAERNLVRGWKLRLPSGQDIARAMGKEPLRVVRLEKYIDGSEYEYDLNKNPKFTCFRDNCPLWVYVLAETYDYVMEGKFGKKTRFLGPVGGTIVAETFAGLLQYDSHSFLNQDPRWKPKIGEGRFGLKEFVNYALGKQ